MTAPALPATTVAGLARGLAAGRWSSVELTQAYLARVTASQSELNAFVTVTLV